MLVLLNLLFGRDPNRVMETACFDGVCLNVADRDSRVEVAGAGAGKGRGCG